ncbi:hypothetical protein [Sphingomonas phage Kimi]|nr:hypothetical protein [Sphingomonas phage Kimi]
MTYDLSSHINREALSKRISDEVEAESAVAWLEPPRKHLGASVIGDDCAYRVWARWRWLKLEKFSGRMMRLFNRGHKEEDRFIERLRGIGFEVHDTDPATGKQFRIEGCEGHFGGSADTFAYAPARYGLDAPLLVEFKTHNEKSFTKLAGKCLQKTPEYKRDPASRQGVQKSKPEHYRQMCSYGRAYGIRFGLYCAVNKDTDELYFEIVELNAGEADDIFRKAEAVVWSQTPLARISQSATYWECKMCNLAGVCHMNHVPDKNCRSCVNARPVPGGEWYCDHYRDNIPFDFMLTGCESWRSII